MTVPFAINGLGRIGRALLRIAAARDDVEVVAVNELVPGEAVARLLARDTLRGPFPDPSPGPGGPSRPGASAVRAEDGALVIGSRRIPLSAASDPAACRWAGTGARVVVEATGAFLGREAADHLRGEVERVVLTANSEAADVTLCLGVNDGDYDPARHRLISNASCTTNCLAPLALVLDRAFGLEHALMTTVHGYTGNQRLLDAYHPEPRRARAAAANVVPVETTAPRALGRILPALAGRVEGLAVRVPTPVVAMLHLDAALAAEPAAGAVRDAFRAAAAGGFGARLAAVLAVTDEELVGSDFVGSPWSAVVDLPLVQATGNLVRVAAWYDNEWGYATRLADLVARLGAP
ncbi:MAG TPA: glyceraldehyde 3-phosphate dehydrogenase NAD-binding domain-containing protein [Thermoanaerobaculia bacterium]|nr:glyceraldehyde 3-phosphate dehydrogenase NAD-binding domain-containing protein [Thermoanaerobaculia bacterium]